jgi:hypothetical protein
MPTTAVDISVQNTTDPNVRGYHTRFGMVDAPESGSRGNSAELGAFGSLFLDIRGVAHVQVGPYILLITKAPLFSWQEIDPEVVKILKMAVTSQRQMQEAIGEDVDRSVD